MEEVMEPLDLDDGSGLRVVRAKFIGEEKFSWDHFSGYDTLRVLTYSASVKTIVKMLDKFSFDTFECVFGCENVLGNFAEVMAFQKLVSESTHLAIMGLKDERHIRILERVRAGSVRFRVVRESISHAKLYLLSNSHGRRRVIFGSANLSEQAFSGRQSEIVAMFDDDDDDDGWVWDYHSKMFNQIWESASDEIPLPKERIRHTEIEWEDTPVVKGNPNGSIAFVQPPAEIREESTSTQTLRIAKVVDTEGPRIASAMGLPSIRNGKQNITAKHIRGASRVRLVKSADEANTPWFSIDRTERTAQLKGNSFPLESDDAQVKAEAQLVLDYFKSYEGVFQGDVELLQSKYFTLTSWLYFSPFMCDMRSRAYHQGRNVIDYKSFAIVYGEAASGKSSLVKTLMISMFGGEYADPVPKKGFQTTVMRNLQETYKRFPVVFDDIGRKSFTSHGEDVIKDETLPTASEFPGFVLSMNKDSKSFKNEVSRRCLMIHTSATLPDDDELKGKLDVAVRDIQLGLRGHLYRRYLQEVMERLDPEQLPPDWLALSSGVLSGIISGSIEQPTPHWCKETTYLSHSRTKYDPVKEQLRTLFRESTRAAENSTPTGWNIDGDQVIVWEQPSFKKFEWEGVPSHLINQSASIPGKTVLYKERLEEFLGWTLPSPHRPWWQPWSRE